MIFDLVIISCKILNLKVTTHILVQKTIHMGYREITSILYISISKKFYCKSGVTWICKYY